MGLVNVIGAGPVGLHCASLLAEEGFEVTVFEEHGTIGRPVQCAGLVSKTGLEELGISPGNSVVNEVRGAKVFSPGGECITVEKNEPVASVIDRCIFDQLLAKKAKRVGCQLRTSSRLIDIRNESLFLESEGHGELVKSKFTVGADGPNSVVRHSVFPGLLDKSFVHAFQIRASGSFNKDLIEMHFGLFAPGFFAWIVPESGSIARIGLAVKQGENSAAALEEFIKQKQLNVKVLSKSSALIPIAAPPKQLVAGNVLLVGDAASQTKATTGGGMVFGLKSAAICAQSIANNLKHRHPLENYMRNLQPINKELAIHWKIYSYIQGMQPEKLDALFQKAKNAGIEKFLQEHGDMDRPSSFMRKVLFSPKMWGLLPAALKAI